MLHWQWWMEPTSRFAVVLILASWVLARVLFAILSVPELEDEDDA